MTAMDSKTESTESTNSMTTNSKKETEKTMNNDTTTAANHNPTSMTLSEGLARLAELTLRRKEAMQKLKRYGEAGDMSSYTSVHSALALIEDEIARVRAAMPPVKDGGETGFFPAVDASTGKELYRIFLRQTVSAVVDVPADSEDEAKEESLRRCEAGEVQLIATGKPMAMVMTE